MQQPIVSAIHLAEALSNTTQLIRLYRDGDSAARDRLVERYLPLMRQWAHGRLPAYVRDLSETDDLVQVTFMRALNKLDSFEAEKPGAFLAYLRAILMNVLRDEIRRLTRRPNQLPLTEERIASEVSVVENAVGGELMSAYEDALSKLPEEKRVAIIMRIEFGMTYEEIARELERSSANSTRMMIVRALAELAESMPTGPADDDA
ncbi:MAG: sigma-70 family RNA polymerase sigma factor [Pseudomonadota bacterium]